MVYKYLDFTRVRVLNYISTGSKVTGQNNAVLKKATDNSGRLRPHEKYKVKCSILLHTFLFPWYKFSVVSSVQNCLIPGLGNVIIQILTYLTIYQYKSGLLTLWIIHQGILRFVLPRLKPSFDTLKCSHFYWG